MHRPGVFGEAIGPEPDLVGRLLAAGVEHRAARRLQPRGRLEQQRGLADARLASDEDHRARHDPAAEHEVELVDPGAPAGERLGGDVTQAVGRLGGLAAGAVLSDRLTARPPDRHRLLRHRIPRPAPLASPDPLGVLVAAFGAAVD